MEKVTPKKKSKKKPFRWNTDMVTNLITCLESFKTEMEYRNVDFDGDRPVQYTALREDMAKLYSGVDVALFGPVTVTQPRVPIRDIDMEESSYGPARAGSLHINTPLKFESKVCLLVLWLHVNTMVCSLM